MANKIAKPKTFKGFAFGLLEDIKSKGKRKKQK